jgi:hypothetical protein
VFCKTPSAHYSQNPYLHDHIQVEVTDNWGSFGEAPSGGRGMGSLMVERFLKKCGGGSRTNDQI